MELLQDPILSIEEVAKATPWSASTLYRIAKEEDSPFEKIAGRWVTTESDLHAWVKRGARSKPPRPAEYPMPKARRERGGQLLANVRERRRAAA